MNKIKSIQIKITQSEPLEPLEDERVELEMRVVVAGMEHTYRDILYIDHFKSRFDHIIEIAKHTIKKLVLEDEKKGGPNE